MFKVYFYQGGNPSVCFEISYLYISNCQAVTNKQILMVEMQPISWKEKTAPTSDLYTYI